MHTRIVHPLPAQVFSSLALKTLPVAWVVRPFFDMPKVSGLMQLTCFPQLGTAVDLRIRATVSRGR